MAHIGANSTNAEFMKRLGGQDMWRIIAVVSSGLMLSACGGGIDSYEDGIEAYAEVMEEMVDVLEGVVDESSAERAAADIEELGSRMAEITARIAELPRPSMDEMQAIAKQQQQAMQGMQEDAAAQMMKMAQYPALLEAWMKAMGNMQ